MARIGRSFPARAKRTGPSPQSAQTVTPTGIASAEAFGVLQVNLKIDLAGQGIASGEAFGTPSVAQGVNPTGIASAEVFGVPQVNLTVGTLTGIGSGEAFGVSKVNLQVSLSGIGSLEAFGVPTVSAPGGVQSLQILLGSISSGESFGRPILQRKRRVFRPPTAGEAYRPHMLNGDLASIVKLPRGITVVKRQDGTFAQVRVEDVIKLTTYLKVYMGGYDYELSAAEEAALTAAGYGPFFVDIYE